MQLIDSIRKCVQTFLIELLSCKLVITVVSSYFMMSYHVTCLVTIVAYCSSVTSWYHNVMSSYCITVFTLNITPRTHDSSYTIAYYHMHDVADDIIRQLSTGLWIFVEFVVVNFHLPEKFPNTIINKSESYLKLYQLAV